MHAIRTPIHAHRRARVPRTGSSLAEALTLVAAVAIAGVGGFASLGGGFAGAIARDAKGDPAGAPTPRTAATVSAEAGVVSASKRLLIVGATGTIGAAVTDIASLEKGTEVVAVARRAPPAWLEPIFARPNVRAERIDAFAGDADAEWLRLLREADGVVLAAEPYPMTRAEVPAARANVERFYESAARAGYAGNADKRIVRVGSPPAETGRFSDIASGDSFRGRFAWEEESPVDPSLAERFPYFAGKSLMRAVAANWGDAGLSILSALPTTVLSWYNHLPKEVDAQLLYATNPLAMYVPNYPISYVAADDAARGVLRVLEAGEPGAAYQLSGNVGRMGEVMLRVLGEAGAPNRPLLWDYPADPRAAERVMRDELSGRGGRGLMTSFGRMGIGFLMGREALEQYDAARSVVHAMGVRSDARARSLGYAPQTSIEEAATRTGRFLRENVLGR